MKKTIFFLSVLVASILIFGGLSLSAFALSPSRETSPSSEIDDSGSSAPHHSHRSPQEEPESSPKRQDTNSDPFDDHLPDSGVEEVETNSHRENRARSQRPSHQASGPATDSVRSPLDDSAAETLNNFPSETQGSQPPQAPRLSAQSSHRLGSQSLNESLGDPTPDSSPKVTSVSNGAPEEKAGESEGPDFEITAQPSARSVEAGQSALFNLVLTSKDGFGSPVSFAISGLPPGIAASFDPFILIPPGSSVLTITPPLSSPAGNFLVTVTALGGEKIHLVELNLDIISPQKITIVVSPTQGGKISWRGLTLEIPSGSVDEEVNITIRALTPQGLPPITGFTFSGRGYEVTAIVKASGVPVNAFNKPLDISISYDPLHPGASDSDKLAIYIWDSLPPRWLPLPSVVDILNHTVITQVNRLTFFAILVPSEITVPPLPGIPPPGLISPLPLAGAPLLGRAVAAPALKRPAAVSTISETPIIVKGETVEAPRKPKPSAPEGTKKEKKAQPIAWFWFFLAALLLISLIFYIGFSSYRQK